MSKSRYAIVLVPLVAVFTALSLLSPPALAQLGGQPPGKGAPSKGPPQKAGPALKKGPPMGARPNVGPQQGARPGPQQGFRPGGARPGFAGGRPGFQRRAFGGHFYRGRLAWDHGRWRHEMRNGRMGWWWDVDGAWYFYEQPMYPYPTMISDVEVVEDPNAAEGPPPDQPVDAGPPGAYPPPPGAYPPPPPAVYVPPPPVYAPPPVVCVGPLCIR